MSPIFILAVCRANLDRYTTKYRIIPRVSMKNHQTKDAKDFIYFVLVTISFEKSLIFWFGYGKC